MSAATSLPRSREMASISSVVVSPLPHSRATRRNGALLTPAIGASRASPLTSTVPIRMIQSLAAGGPPPAGLTPVAGPAYARAGMGTVPGDDPYAVDAEYYDLVHASHPGDDTGLWLSFAGRTDRPVL